MPVFAPGTWAGVNDALAINRQNQRDQLNQQEQRLRIQRERESQTRELRARQGFGAGMYSTYGMPPPQPPMPGQSSAPAGGPPPPQGAAMGGPPAPQGPPQGPPQGGMPPPMQQGAQQGPPQGAPPQGPQEGPAIARARGDVAALNRELMRPGLNAEQKQIMNSELAKAKERVAQLSGREMPYRAVPSSPPAGGAPQGGPPQGGMQGPPPVTPTGQGQQPSLLQRFVRSAQANGVPPEDLADQIKMLTPIMQDEMKQELLTLRGTQAENNSYIRSLMAEVAQMREQRLQGQGDRKGDQKDRALDQADERIKVAREKVASGQVPTKSELDDPQVADYWYQQYKRGGDKPPFAWGKAGEEDRRAWMRLLASKGDAGETVAGRAEGKAATNALAANEKRNVGLDVGARETLADMDTLDSILTRVETKGGAKVFNRPINKLRELGSDPEYGQLELATKQVAMKYERMLAGGILSVAQLHEGAREDAKKIMNGDMTAAEIRAKLPLMKREMKNAQKAGKDTSADVRGKLSGKDESGGKVVDWGDLK